MLARNPAKYYSHNTLDSQIQKKNSAYSILRNGFLYISFTFEVKRVGNHMHRRQKPRKCTTSDSRHDDPAKM